MNAEPALRYRLRAQHLDVRLPPGSLSEAAAGGLQDSAPRTALLSLHARCSGVGPGDWAAEELVQVWGPRSAVYVVPRSAVAAFTIGRLPRDERVAARILELGERAAVLAAGSPRTQSEMETELDLPRGAFRAIGMSGRVLLRWDTRTTTVVAAPPPSTDVEGARLDLARRYLRWFGPATPAQFARWAGTEEDDAAITLEAAGEPAPLEQHSGAAISEHVRLLPPGDPYLFRDRGALVPDRAAFEALFRPKGHLAGGLLVDGRIVGTWSRQQRNVVVRPWAPMDHDRLAAEVELMAGPLGGPVRLTVA